MNNKQKVKLIAYLTASSMLLYGCKMTINNFLNKDKQDVPKKDFNTEQTIEGSETKETELTIETIIPTEIEIETTNTEPETIPTIEVTEPVIEPTEEIVLPNEIVVRATTNVNIRSSNTADSLKIGLLNKNDFAYKILSC